MNTPMQEMLEWVRATLPMDLDWPMLIEEKVQSLIQKEKDVIENAVKQGWDYNEEGLVQWMGEKYYNETFNTEVK